MTDRVSSSSRTRTLPSRPSTTVPSQQPSTRVSSKTNTGSMLNIAGKKVSRAGHEDIFYSSDSELGAGAQQSQKDTKKVVKRSNSQMRHKTESSKSSSVVMRNGEFYEQIDSGWTSRDSSSMDRSSSVSLEEKMDELELGKMRKTVDMRSEMNLSTQQFVGFGLLPDQVYNKAVRKGFEFSLMVVGASGLGKSTLVNSMFLTDIYADCKEGVNDNTNQEVGGEGGEQTLRVETHNRVLVENGVKLSLTVIDTPGFGEAVDNTECWTPILDYVEDQFDGYLEAETSVERSEIKDKRVHACLYFIAPTGHGLKPLDVEVMKKIHKKVNIIPVIGKADSCTVKEVNMFKTKILLQLQKHEIQIYNFPVSELESEHHWMRERMPFAVVGSNITITDPDTGHRYRGREYPWGCVNIEDKDHCDFLALRNLVLAHHMEDLKETTHKIHYERFRFDKLREMMGGPRDGKVKSGDIEEEYKKSVRDFDRRHKMKTSRKNSFLTDIKYKSLESILGGQKVRNMLNSINFK